MGRLGSDAGGMSDPRGQPTTIHSPSVMGPSSIPVRRFLSLDHPAAFARLPGGVAGQTWADWGEIGRIDDPLTSRG